MSDRVAVAKTYKLYLGGAFPRSESGRSYPIRDVRGGFLANAAQASRKDVRDAVAAARKAFAGWSGATAYNRGQVLYRVAELLEGRRDQFISEVVASEGAQAKRAQSIVDAAVDRWVWYAGWADKVASVLGASNPVAGPYFSFSVPAGGSFGSSAFIGRQLSPLFTVGIEGGFFGVENTTTVSRVDCPPPSVPGSLDCDETNRAELDWIQLGATARLGKNDGSWRPYGALGLGIYFGTRDTEVSVANANTGTPCQSASDVVVPPW
jgi:hypothetical protein